MASFDAPSGTGQNAALTYDGTYLWLSGTIKIFKLGISDCTVISSFSAPCSRPESLAWDGEHLWCASFDGGKIYQIDISVPTPSAPPSLEAAGGDSYVELSWDLPADDGGAAITNYNIYRVTTSGGGTLLATVGNVLIYTDNDVTNDVTYYYQVSAVNSAGEGARSEEASAKASKSDPDIFDDIDLNAPIIAALITALAIIAAAIINYLPSRKSKEYGSVSATSRPDGARVVLDGVEKGESPLRMDKIRKGTHIVLFSKSGYSDCEKRVVVNADQITSVHCDLKKPEIKLVLSAEPTKIPADGKSKSVITVGIDANGVPVPAPKDTEIVLETNIGLIDTPVTILKGDVSTTSILTSSTAGGTATVKVESKAGLKNDIVVRFV